MGDNNAIGNMANQLKGALYLEGFELETKEEPYGIILNYNSLDSEQSYQEISIYNATFLFELVQNVDWITFHFDNREYTLTKANLQEWYGTELNDWKNEAQIRESLEENLKDEQKVNQLFDL